jgi:hypothetical protein
MKSFESAYIQPYLPKFVMVLLLALGNLSYMGAAVSYAQIPGIIESPPISLDDKYVSESFVRERWLGFLKEGVTTRQEVLDNLGEPSEQYEGGRIIAYRLLLAEDDRKTLKKYFMIWCGQFEGWKVLINKRREALSRKERLLVFKHELMEKLWRELLAREAEYSLVVIFDDQGITKKSSLRRILP